MTYSPVINSMVNKAFQIRGTNNFVSSGVRRKLESYDEWDVVFHSHLVALLIQETGKNTKKNDGPGTRPFRTVSVIQGRTHGRGKKRLSWMLILTLNIKQNLPTKPLRQLQSSILDRGYGKSLSQSSRTRGIFLGLFGWLTRLNFNWRERNLYLGTIKVRGSSYWRHWA